MFKKIVLLIFISFYSKKIFPCVSSSTSIVRNIRTDRELLRESFDNLNTVTRVRTTAELRAEENKFATLDFIGLVQQYSGYQAEEYDVLTEDGYILKLHRIISSPHSPNITNKPVVFIQHGLFGCSDNFVNLGPNHDLAFMIADAGYDVWLGNVRGNFYSRRHVEYLPASNNYDFWKFNLDDHALKDAPAMIDEVLKKTNKKHLIYIGYSMGTTMNYMLLSSKPEYNNKIKLSISLAPAAYFVRPFSLFLNFLLALRLIVFPLFYELRIYEFLPLSNFIVIFAKTICSNSVGVYICGTIMSPVLNFNNVNRNNVTTIFSNVFNGASLDIIVHFAQIINKETFRKFDFGPLLNQKIYNSSEPPEYDLSKVTAPQAIFYANHEAFIHPRAAEKVKNSLKNVVAFENVPEPYNHLDFAWAKNARIELYDQVLNLIQAFS